jgi:hypothetical protein
MELGVGADLFALGAVHLLGPLALGFHVEHIDHHRSDGRNPPVHGAGKPGGPAAFGRAPHHEPPDFHPELRLRLGLHGVHPSHGRLGHRKEQRPGGIAGLEKLIERVGDEIVLFKAVIQRLIGDAVDDRGDRPGALGQRSQNAQLAFHVSVAGDEQERDVRVAHFGRPRQEQLMMPRLAAPSLRGAIQPDQV